jgi:hypothetical protein
MRRSARVGGVVLAALLAGIGCGRKAPEVPGRGVVTPLLQQEAADLKRENEKFDPVLRVRATWTVAGIDVTERPGDLDRPWAGTIRFRIRGETNDSGSVVVDEFDREFHYVYTTSIGKWIFQLDPSPAP